MHPYPVPPHRCIILSIGPIPASPLADASYHFTHLHLQSAPRNRPQAQIHLAPSMNSTSTLRFLVFPTLSHLFMIAFKYLLAAAGNSVKVASSKKMGELLPVLPLAGGFIEAHAQQYVQLCANVLASDTHCGFAVHWLCIALSAQEHRPQNQNSDGQSVQ